MPIGVQGCPPFSFHTPIGSSAVVVRHRIRRMPPARADLEATRGLFELPWSDSVSEMQHPYQGRASWRPCARFPGRDGRRRSMLAARKEEPMIDARVPGRARRWAGRDRFAPLLPCGWLLLACAVCTPGWGAGTSASLHAAENEPARDAQPADPVAQPADASAQPADARTGRYTTGRRSRDGIGKFYMGREISFVMGHEGAYWLEREERETEEKPEQVVEAMDLQPDSVVADIGAGTGYFSFRIAPRIPRGKVLAVDIQPEMLEAIEKKKVATGIANVETVLGSIEDPKLAPESIDLALLVDAYHEFSHPHEMMSALVRALRPGGRIVLVEYRGEDPSVPILPLHKMTEAQAVKEMATVGLHLLQNFSLLPQQHLMVFEKRAAGAGSAGKPAGKEGELR